MSKRMRRVHPAIGAIVALTSALLIAAGLDVKSAHAEAIKVGKSSPNAWIFSPADVGIDLGIWKKHGLDIEILSFPGDARLNQALAADAAEIGLAGGTNVGFAAKGVPVKAIAVLMNAPAFLGVVVGTNPAIKSVQDLKGKKIAVSNPSSLTYFFARELSRRQGWGPDGVTPVPLGVPTAMLAALKAGQVDGIVTSAEFGYSLELKNEGRTLMTFGQMADYHSLVIFATDKMIAERPKVVRAFLAAWFETIAWMRQNRDKAIELSNKLSKLPPEVAAKTYDAAMPTFSLDGRFNQAALQKVLDSASEIGVADKDAKIDLKTLYTEEFLPAK